MFGSNNSPTLLRRELVRITTGLLAMAQGAIDDGADFGAMILALVPDAANPGQLTLAPVPVSHLLTGEAARDRNTLVALLQEGLRARAYALACESRGSRRLLDQACPGASGKPGRMLGIAGGTADGDRLLGLWRIDGGLVVDAPLALHLGGPGTARQEGGAGFADLLAQARREPQRLQ